MRLSRISKGVYAPHVGPRFRSKLVSSLQHVQGVNASCTLSTVLEKPALNLGVSTPDEVVEPTQPMPAGVYTEADVEKVATVVKAAFGDEEARKVTPPSLFDQALNALTGVRNDQMPQIQLP